MDSNSIVKKNTVYNSIKTLLSFIYPLIAFPYVSRVLMPESIGKVAFSSSIVGYISLLASLGIPVYAIRECSKVKHNQELLEKIASEIFSINVFSMIFAYLCLSVFIICCSSIRDYIGLIVFMSFSVFFVTVGTDWINTVMEDFKYLAIRTAIIQFLSIIFLFIFVKSPDDYYFFAFISVFSASSTNILNFFYRKKFCRIRFTFATNYKKHLPQILILFSLLLSQIVFTASDITILGFVKGDYETGLYNMSVNVYRILNMFIASIAWVTMPKLTVAFNNQDYNSVNSLLRYTLNFILVMGLPFIAVILIICPHLLYSFFGEIYVNASTSLRFLAVALFFSFFGGWIVNMMLIPAGKDKICLYICIICALCNLILNIIFIPVWGLNAAAATSCISQVIGFVASMFFIDKKIRISSFLDVIWLPAIGSAGIVFIGYFIQLMFVSPWVIVIGTTITSVIWYFSFLLLLKNELVLSVFNFFCKRLSLLMNISDFRTR